LAGAWRGVFAHKNEAGAIMALFVFFGVFVTRFSNVIAGTLMVIGAAAFLICTSAKTSLIILPLVFLISYFARRARRTRWLVCLCLGPLIAFNALVLLACYNADVDRMLSFALSDSSFTGRTDVWQFAIDNIVEKPMVGHGFMAFWRTEDVFDSPNEAEAAWANTASHSHNGYLDIALTTGLPGLVLAVAFVVVVPIINYQRSRTRFWRAGDWPTRAVSTLLLRVWLFGIYFNSFESALFDRGNKIWFFLLTAIFGLHYISRFPVVDEHVKRDDAFLGPFGAS
jgi:O-antigen ligase